MTDPWARSSVPVRPAGRAVHDHRTPPSPVEPENGHPRGYRAVVAVLVLAALFSVGPSLVGVVADGRTTFATLTQSTPSTAFGSALGTLLSTTIIVIAAFTLLGWRGGGRPPTGAGTLAVVLLPWFTVVFSDALNGYGQSRQAILYPLLALFVWRVAPPRGVLRVLGPTVVAIAVLSVLMLAVVPGLAYYANAGNDLAYQKSLVGGRLLAGPYSHPNSFGGVLALGLPFVLTIERRRVRLASFVVVLGVLVLTGARTSIVAGAAVTAVYALTRWPRLRAVAVRVLLAGGAIAIVATPVLTSNEVSFSSRGEIWQGALSAWAQRPVQGNGTGFFTSIGQVANDLGAYAFTGHNLFVDTGVRFGVLGVLAWLLLLVTATRVALRGSDVVWPSAFLVAFLFENWLEARNDLLNLGQFGFLTWLPLMILIFDRHRTSSSTAERSVGVHEHSGGTAGSAAPPR